jgi:hypothetical protein
LYEIDQTGEILKHPEAKLGDGGQKNPQIGRNSPKTLPAREREGDFLVVPGTFVRCSASWSTPPAGVAPGRVGRNGIAGT